MACRAGRPHGKRGAAAGRDLSLGVGHIQAACEPPSKRWRVSLALLG